jgi:hypothetical protein
MNKNILKIMNKEEKIKKFIETLDMPRWGYINEVKSEYHNIIITYCDSYYIRICPITEYEDVIYSESDIAWGKQDLEFVMDIFDNRDEIIEMWES